MKRSRAAATVAALLLATFGLGAGPALADDPPPPLIPPGVSAPTPTVRPSPGPTFVVTPGSPGGDLGEDSGDGSGTSGNGSTRTPQKSGTKKPAAQTTDPATPVAGSGAEPVSSVGVSSSEALSWKLGAGAVLLFVLGEFTRIGFRRRPTGA